MGCEAVGNLGVFKVASSIRFWAQRDSSVENSPIYSSGAVTYIRRREFGLPPQERPRVVLLQGPVGPFFSKLRKSLDASGYDVWQVSLNAGDALFAGRGGKCIRYKDGERGWERWFRELLIEGRFEHVILFGSDRPAHSAARRVASSLGVNIVSLEEGYIRPGAITVEEGGNNRLSPISGRLPPPDFRPAIAEAAPEIRGSFPSMCVYGATYYAAAVIFSASFQAEMFHRQVWLHKEAIRWTRNLYRRVVTQSKNVSIIERLLEHHVGQYFIVPLQVSQDTQLKAAARGWNNGRLIRETLQSFAAKAPGHMRLVFKIHPLERGCDQDRLLIQEMAKKFGVSSRIDLIDVGSIGHLTRHSAGMITINSTSGLSAIFHGVPLLVIGDALYANPKLATCARGFPDFEAFWKGGHVAGVALRHRYIAWVREMCLRPGDFYTSEGMEAACRAVLEAVNSRLVLKQRSLRAA